MQLIKRQIRVVNQTSHITRAMHLISSARIRRSLQRYDSNLLYFNRVRQTMKEILSHIPDYSHPYLHTELTHGRRAFFVIASDKGMAGSYNHDVCNAAMARIGNGADTIVFPVGHMAQDFFTREGIAVNDRFVYIGQNPQLYHARHVVQLIERMFQDDEVDEVYIAYTRMLSSTQQEARVERLLPVLLQDFDGVQLESEFSGEIFYEPNPQSVMDHLVPQYLVGLLYGMLVQAHASEHCMRIQAMEQATRNADEILAKLKLEYNRARQAAITNEISEILAGAQAMSEREDTHVE